VTIFYCDIDKFELFLEELVVSDGLGYANYFEILSNYNFSLS